MTVTEAANVVRAAIETRTLYNNIPALQAVLDHILADAPSPKFEVGQMVVATMDCWGEPHSRPRCIEKGRTHVVSAISSDGLHFKDCNGKYPAECFEPIEPEPEPVDAAKVESLTREILIHRGDVSAAAAWKLAEEHFAEAAKRGK